MQPAIRIEKLSKRYRLGSGPAGGRTLPEALTVGARNLARRMLGRPARSDQPAGEFWALREVSFEVQPGEAVGIIGRNGAGKSTLLKVLSRIVQPTAGRAEVRGRMGSLLEVGTGFHPELTGRENVYLNGSILGMTRREVARKFDAIVAFAGVDEFLDTPVKRYSSGMYVRLAFAVAAHLEPEILVVDEVLAVGDAAFQKKCLEAMRNVASSGRTVLVVSHQLDIINRLCRQAVWLDRGQVMGTGPATDMVAAYLGRSGGATPTGVPVDLSDVSRTGTGAARFTRMALCGRDGGLVYSGGALQVDVWIRVTEPLTVGAVAVTLYDLSGFKLVNADTLTLDRRFELPVGESAVRFFIRGLHLNPGRYRLGLWLARHPHGVLDLIPAAGELEVFTEPERPLGPRPNSDGVVRCEFDVTELPVAPPVEAG